MILRARIAWLATWIFLPFIAVGVAVVLVAGTGYIWWREDVRLRKSRRWEIHGDAP